MLPAIFADTHVPRGSRRLPDACVARLQQADVIVHDGGPAGGRTARLRRRFTDADAVVFAHSQMPLHDRGADGFQIFNPGSPTERRRAPRHTMGLARVEAGTVSFELIALS